MQLGRRVVALFRGYLPHASTRIFPAPPEGRNHTGAVSRAADPRRQAPDYSGPAPQGSSRAQDGCTAGCGMCRVHPTPLGGWLELKIISRTRPAELRHRARNPIPDRRTPPPVVGLSSPSDMDKDKLARRDIRSETSTIVAPPLLGAKLGRDCESVRLTPPPDRLCGRGYIT